MRKHFFLFVCVGLFIGSTSCKKTDEAENTQNVTPSNQPTQPSMEAKPDSATIMKPILTQIIQQYYKDLEAEKLDEKQYFAPTVAAFFNAKNVSSDVVGKSIKEGFAKMDNRTFSLNQDEIQISAVPQGYELIVAGTATHTEVKTKKQVSGAFRNSIVFDKNNKIVSYTQAPEVASGERGLNQEESENDFANRLVSSIQNAKNIDAFVDEKEGLLNVYRMGVYDRVAKVNSSKKVDHLKEILKNVKCKGGVKLGKLPSFDCDKEFNEKGCFMVAVEDFAEVTNRMKTINKMGLSENSYKKDEINADAELEKKVTHVIVITEAYLYLGVGKIDGKWHVFVIDSARYDCSA